MTGLEPATSRITIWDSNQFHAEARVHVLLREHADRERVVAAFEAALEFQVHGFRVVVAENDVFGFDVLDILLLLLALLDVAVQFAVLRDRVTPEFRIHGRSRVPGRL